MSNTLSTIEAVIDAVGGTSAAASIAGVAPGAVSNWKARGRIPAEFFFVFASRLEREGQSVDRDLFGFVNAEARA